MRLSLSMARRSSGVPGTGPSAPLSTGHLGQSTLDSPLGRGKPMWWGTGVTLVLAAVSLGACSLGEEKKESPAIEIPVPVLEAPAQPLAAASVALEAARVAALEAQAAIDKANAEAAAARDQAAHAVAGANSAKPSAQQASAGLISSSGKPGTAVAAAVKPTNIAAPASSAEPASSGAAAASGTARPAKKPGLISPALLDKESGSGTSTSNRRRTTNAPTRPGAN